MFRDLKEYQEIAKIYADKVSKPENLDENRNQMATKLRLEREANKPAPEPKVKPQYQQNRDKLNQQRTELNKGRAAKQFSALKAKPMVRKPGATSVRQSGANDSRLLKNKVDTPKPDPKPEIKKVEVKKEPEVSTMTKQGKPRTKAQMMAAKRIAAGKTIDDVKAENQASMKARAKAKFEAFKKRRAEKKLDKQRDFDDPDKRMNRGESYTPYDIVLEYLLSTEQVATIEEANYVMTEMDAETIQGIVEEQKKTLIEKPDDGYIGPKFLGIKNPMNKARKDYQMDYKLKKLSGTGDSPETRDMLNIPRDYEITPEQKKKYGFK